MVKAPKPPDEDARLKDLQGFEILDTPREKEYDGLVELVSQICQCPIAIVNFLDSNRQWFKASKNLNTRESSRDESFCGHAIMRNEVLIVSDATKDDRFHDNPDVTGGLKVRFYAGAPIVSPNGFKLGTVCAIDNEPKHLSHSQVTALKTVAEQVSRLLEMRKKNKEMQQAAASLISTQKKLVQMNMSEMESKNYQAAFVLHEEINQAISAVKRQIEQARSDQSLSKEYLAATVEELDQLTSHVTKLSDTLAPAIFNKVDYRVPIEKLVHDIEHKERIRVELKFVGKSGILKQEKGLMIIGVLKDLFRFAILSASRSPRLSIEGNKDLDIIFEYDSRKFLLEDQKVLLQASLMNRLEVLEGQYEKTRFESGQIRIHIQIPDAIS